MSKRKNFQAKRRQVRRVLNACGDAILSVGTRKTMRLSYGCGLTRGHVRNDIKNARTDRDEYVEVIY